MFGLGGKTADDKVWLAVAKEHSGRLAELAELLDSAYWAVVQDRVRGWMDVRDVMQELPEMKKSCKEIQRSFKTIGRPAKQSSWREVDEIFKTFNRC